MFSGRKFLGNASDGRLESLSEFPLWGQSAVRFREAGRVAIPVMTNV